MWSVTLALLGASLVSPASGAADGVAASSQGVATPSTTEPEVDDATTTVSSVPEGGPAAGPVDDTTGIEPMAAMGSISGTVRAFDTGLVVPDIYVCATPAEGGSVDCEYTGTDGKYLIGDLETTSYRVRFHDFSGDYATEWYGGHDYVDAVLVAVAAGTEVQGIDVSLDRPGIAGTVTSGPAGDPVVGISVCAVPSIDFDVRCATTGTDGRYRIDGLDRTMYRVHFAAASPAYVTQYYDGVSALGDATLIEVLGETSAVLGIDAVLVPAGTITGTVTADMTGEPLSGIYVCAMPVVEGLGACGFTRDDGTYGLHEVALGDHRVRFYDMNGDAYVDEYYDDVDDPDDATLVAVTVTGGVVAGIDAGLALKGAIEGTLSVDGGGPVGGGEVCALSAVGVIARCGHALSDGTYTIAGLNPGSYRVEIRANGPYVSEFYDDVFSYAEATPVEVTVGSTTTGIDASLSRAGTLSGLVTVDGSDDSIEGIEVCADSTTADVLRCDTTRSNGEYVITELPAGHYEVSFTDWDGVYQHEYFDDAPDHTTAQLVTVGAGADIRDIDAGLALAPAISGTVTADDTGGPLAGITVCALPMSGPSTCDTTDDDGAYSIGTDPGGHHISFSGGADYADEYYDDVHDRADATVVTVAAGPGGQVTGIDAGLGLAASIEGSIVGAGADRGGVRWIDLVALDGGRASQVVFFGTSFALGGITPGHYKAVFREYGPERTILSSWYGGSNEANATVLHLRAGEHLSGLEFETVGLGSVSGTVLDGAAPVTDGTVHLYDAATLAPVAEASLDGSGGFSFTGVSVGRYVVVAMVPGLTPQLYRDAGGDPSVEITVHGEVVTGVDIAVERGAGISGKITSSGGGPFTGPSARIELWAADDVWLPTASGTVDPSGNYQFDGIPEGTYRVRAVSGAPGHLPTWWDDGGSGVATEVALAAGAHQTGIDVELMAAASVMVNLTDPAGDPMSGDVTVSLYRTDQRWLASHTSTAVDGSVSFDNVAPGEYEVIARPPAGSNLQPQWHGGTSVRAESTTVTVVIGSPTSLTIVLPADATITGAVVAGGGMVPGAVVRAYRDGTGFHPDYVARAGSGGTFELRGLAPGTYRLLVTAPGFASVWLGQTPDRAQGTPVSVAAGKRSAGHIIALDPEGDEG